MYVDKELYALMQDVSTHVITHPSQLYHQRRVCERVLRDCDRHPVVFAGLYINEVKQEARVLYHTCMSQVRDSRVCDAY